MCLDFHIFDIFDFNLLLGSPLEKLLTSYQGSLDEMLRENASATAIPCLENPLAKKLPEQNLLGDDPSNSVCIIRARSLGSCKIF